MLVVLECKLLLCVEKCDVHGMLGSLVAAIEAGITFIRYAQNRKIGKPKHLRFIFISCCYKTSQYETSNQIKRTINTRIIMGCLHRGDLNTCLFRTKQMVLWRFGLDRFHCTMGDSACH
jgi:hypothetical protein